MLKSARIMKNFLIQTRSSNALFKIMKHQGFQNCYSKSRYSRYVFSQHKQFTLEGQRRAWKKVHKTKYIQFHICTLKEVAKLYGTLIPSSSPINVPAIKLYTLSTCKVCETMHLCWISLFNISQGLYLIFAVYWAFRRIFRFKQSYSTLKFFIIQLSWLQCITNHKRRVLHPHFIISVHCNIQVMDLTENMGFKNNITSNRHDENQIFQLQMWCTLTL